MERNIFLEKDGLFYQNETHEWFNDKASTDYARKKSVVWGAGTQNDALNVFCFVVRDKETGKYDRVIVDVKTNEIIFGTKSLEVLGSHIDMLKVQKRFGAKKR
jgi:hypothetical protein